MDWATVAKELKRSFKDYRQRTDCVEDVNGVYEAGIPHARTHTHMHFMSTSCIYVCTYMVYLSSPDTASVKGKISRAPQGNVLECLNLTSNGEPCLWCGC